MSADISPRHAAPNWSCCLLVILGPVALVGFFVVLSLFSLGNFMRGPNEQDRINAWQTQVEDLKRGVTSVRWPEPLCLEEFVRDQPELAAKITKVDFFMGTVADPRFGYVKQFSNLKEIGFDEVWEGTDAFLQRIAGMKSVRTLSFDQSPVTVEGARAIASFPNLGELAFDHYWNDASLQQLRGHKGIKTLSLIERVEITDELIGVMASLPNLLELDIDTEISVAERQKLQKALPKLKINN